MPTLSHEVIRVARPRDFDNALLKGLYVFPPSPMHPPGIDGVTQLIPDGLRGPSTVRGGGDAHGIESPGDGGRSDG
ncbi:hypothetical protein SDC9_179832 [bioreactor metagenome]|uniref:Uncharacterized protein n=1 Tax=bioreactor metagenome TaxID=1076179 RepID=A0A645H7U8_9ZZZZ